MVRTITCAMCGVEVETTGSTQRYCPGCRSERVKAQGRARGVARRGKRKAASRAYYTAHSDERRAYAAAYRAAHPDEWRAYNTAWVAAHKDERRAYNTAYRAAHTEQQRERNRVAKASRTACKYGAPGSFTAEQFALLVEAADGRCYYCGCRPPFLTCDHAVPLSRGGSNFVENILPACSTCNSRKHTRTSSEYLAYLGLLPLAADTPQAA